MAAQVHKNDIGTIYRVTVKDQDNVVVDISGASTKQILFKKADGTTMTKTASFTNSGSDGKMQWTAIAGDNDTVGDLVYQGKVILTAGTFYSTLLQTKIVDNVL